MRAIYEELVKKHSDELYRFAYRYCGKGDIAEDLVAETFTEAWRSIDKLRDQAKGRAWLFQILRHRCSHWVRDRGRRVQAVASVDELPESASTTPLTLEHLAQREALQLALGDLDQLYREPFLMVYLEGQSCQQTADELDLPLGTVLSRLYRAKESLRTKLGAFDYSQGSESKPPLPFPKEGAS